MLVRYADQFEPAADLPARAHPYTHGLYSNVRYYDFRARPELISTVLEDFLPWAQYPAVQRFYEMLRHTLLKVRGSDSFLWLLRWLKNEKHCLPAIYEEITRTASLRRKMGSLNVGARYLSPSHRC